MSDAELSESDRSRLLQAGFRIDRLIGAGAMGFVFQATQLSLSRQVALKVLQSTAATTSDLIRFRSEATTLQKIQHPNVVRMLDFSLDTKPPYLAMELVPGARTVADFLASPSTPAQRLDIARGILQGLSAAHEHEIIHRDLKPANVLLDPSNTVRLIDFGLARALNSDATRATQDGAILGTLSYMSPEQLFGRPVLLTSDVYSCALLLIEVLAGRPIFSTEAAPADRVIYSDRIATGVPPLTRWLRDLDPKFQRELTRAVSPDPKDRPRSAAHLLSALPTADDSTPSSSAKTGVLPPPPKPARQPHPKQTGPTQVLAPPAAPPSMPRFRRALALPVALILAAFVLLLFRRPAPQATPTASPRPTAPANEELTLVTEGDLLVLRISSDHPQQLTLCWTEGTIPHTQSIAPDKRQFIRLSGPDFSHANDLKLTRADGTAIDLLSLATPQLTALRASLDRLPAERIISAIQSARSRATQGAQIHDIIAPLIPRDLPRTISRLAPISRAYLTSNTDSTSRPEFLNALYRAELIDSFLERSRAPRFLSIADALPADWSERSYRAQDPEIPRNKLSGGTNSQPPISLSINSKSVPNRNRVMVGSDWTYVPLPALIEFSPKTDKVFDNVLGEASRKSSPSDQVIEFEIPEPVMRPCDSVLIDLFGLVLGEGILWLHVNDSYRVPFYCGEADGSDAKRTEGRDFLRRVPGSAFRVGRNCIRIEAAAYPSRGRTPAAWLHWVLLVASHKRRP